MRLDAQSKRGMACARRPAALGLLVMAWAACAPPAWIERPPGFPPGPQVWDLPLYEPLTRLGPHVVATAVGSAAVGGQTPTQEVLLYVDSGSSRAAFTPQTFARLGVRTQSARLVTIEDAAGVKRGWVGGVVPGLRLVDGPALANLPASVADHTQVLGADVLGAGGWQIDLDAGILRLNPDPWTPGPDIVTAPARRFGNHAIVDLRVAGTTVPLLVDTGAPMTVVDAAVLRRLGLPEHRLTSPWPLGGAGRTSARLETSFDAALGLGAAELGVRRVFAHPGGNSVGQGMLGNDILDGYAFQVTPAGLALRRRTADLLASTPGRIARWHDLPVCAGAAGCLTVDLAAPRGPAEAPRVRVRFLAVPPRPFRYLFGCLDGAGHLGPSPFWIDVAVRQPAPGAQVDIPLAPEVPSAFSRSWASACAGLALLDANPIVDGARPLPPVAEAHLAPDMRRASFR